MYKQTLAAALALACVGSVFAQSATSRTAGTTALGAAAKQPSIAVKKLKAARDLELDLLKASREAGATFQKCLEAAKTGPSLVGCKTAHRDSLNASFAKQVDAGRIADAYEVEQGSAPTN